MIDVNSIDAIPGEGEILTLMANYMAHRLFTKRQRRSLSVIIDVTREPVRAPVTRRMLGPQKAGLGTRPPKLFEMTVSTAAGLRDAAEVVAHELLHISQAVNGRLQITEKRKKSGRRKVRVHMARWMGGKPVVMDDIAWNLRPWEIEACGWQGQLVSEFLMLSTGQPVDQPVQPPKRKQLALYPVSVPAPVSPVLQEPVFAADSATAEPHMPDADSVAPGHVLEANEASIDKLMDGLAPESSQADESLAAAVAGAGFDAGTDMPAATASAEDDTLVAGLAADLAAEIGQELPTDTPATGNGPDSMLAGTADGNGVGNGAGNGHSAHPARPEALPDAPVYSKPVIEVDVPGLDAPRALQRDAIARKLGELRKRGLTTAEIGGL
ncbi:MAG: hypothetical protein VXW17_08490 [Pseudomonadota bacterium]|nr:hypothetical protein [Pseudomonadota bacterium]